MKTNLFVENIELYKKKIEVPPILIWGHADTAVPVEDAPYAETVMKDAGLIVYEGCTHYAYLERINQTINILNSFLKEGK